MSWPVRELLLTELFVCVRRESIWRTSRFRLACALNLVVFRAAVDHELDEDELVQARLRGDVPTVPVPYLFLVRVCSAHGVMVRTN